MTLGEVLRSLRDSGVTLALDGHDGLRINAPKGAVTPDLRDRLVAHKAALLRLLREGESDDGLPLPACTPDPAALHEPFPLSDLQIGFYMADDPYMEFHVRPHYYLEKDIDGLDVARYEAAWNKALLRHRNEIVVVRDDGMLQTLADPAPLRAAVNDWRDEPAEAARARLLALRAQMMRAELPLDRWPWLDLRVSLWREAGRTRTRIHYNHNNFFSDGYGTTRLLQEVERCYADPSLELPPISLSFRDAALALERLAESESGQASRRYWEERLPALPDAVPLPLRAGVDRRCRSKLQRREGFVDAPTWAALKQQARQAGLTPSSAVFAVYAELLSAWSNCRHFVLSNMMTRRLDLHPEMRSIVGNFASLYPLEIDLRERASFRDGAVRLQEQVSRDARHTHWGGMRVMQALNHRRNSMGSAPVPFVIGSGLFMDGFERSDFSCLETSQVMLDHQFWELADGRLYFVWDLLEEFFPAGMVDDMWGAYDWLIRALASDAALWEHDGFDLLPPWQRDERRPAPVDSRSVPADRLCDLLPAPDSARAAEQAVVCGSERLHYASIVRGARAVAAALHAAGVGSGHRVAIVAERGARWLQAVHGTQLAGAAHVPIDPAMPVERCHVMVEDCAATLVLCTERHAGRDWPADLRVVVLEQLPPDADAIDPPADVTADSLAYIIYTSGSTGRPKGVMIDHRGVLNTVRDVNRRFGIASGDRLFGVSSIGFDLSVYDVFGALAAGACVVYPEPEQALNPAHWLDLLAEEQVTVWNSAPPLATLLAEAAASRGALLPSLRLVMLSGDWIPLDLPQKLRRIAPNARIVSLGGATEASIWSIVYEIGDVDPAWSSIPYGRAMDNQSWHVLDEHGAEVPAWVAGDLYIGGVGLAQGYWNDKVKTTAAFIVHEATGQRLYRTGDMGRFLPGGLIEFLGRRDSQVKVQGHRIELGEIEAALSAHPAVSAAVVVAHGGGPAAPVQLAAHVVAREGAQLDASALVGFLGVRLPRYMVPSRIALHAALPLSASGKVDRRQLQALLPPADAAPPRPLRAPCDPVESRMLELWGRVLGREIVGVGDDFFEIGGQSFEAVRLVGVIKEAFGTRLSLGDVWQHRTVDRLADLVRSQAPRPRDPLRVLVDAGAGTPLFLVHPAGGHVLCYRHLAALLRRPVHAFEAAGVTGACEPLDTVEAMAAQYLDALKRCRPAGPVLVGGWSSGGPIAFELAAMLRAQGREVDGVVIVDSPAPVVLPPVDRATLLGWFVEDLALAPQAVRLARAVPPGESDHRDQLVRVADALSAHGLSLTADPEQLAPIYRTFEAIVRANRRYDAPLLDVDLLMLRAADGAVSEFAAHPQAADADWGWQRRTRVQVRTEFVAGTHHSLLGPETAGACAAHIEAWIASRTHSSTHADTGR